MAMKRKDNPKRLSKDTIITKLKRERHALYGNVERMQILLNGEKTRANSEAHERVRLENKCAEYDKVINSLRGTIVEVNKIAIEDRHKWQADMEQRKSENFKLQDMLNEARKDLSLVPELRQEIDRLQIHNQQWETEYRKVEAVLSDIKSKIHTRIPI
jgi:hypothetical protein